MITYANSGTIRKIDDEFILIKLIEFLHEDIGKHICSIIKEERNMAIRDRIKSILYNEFNISMYYIDELMKKVEI